MTWAPRMPVVGVAAWLAMWAIGCAQLEGKDDVRIAVAGPSTLKVGARIQLTAETANGIRESYRWRSSDDAVALVDRAGRVEGRRPGAITIAAIGTVTDQQGSHRVTVTARELPGLGDAGPKPDAGNTDAAGDAAPDADAPGDAAADTGMSDAGDADTDGDAHDAEVADADAVSTPSFARDVHPLLLARCGNCHAAGGLAGGTRCVLVDDLATDHEMLLDLVNTASPDESRLLTKARGDDGHGGGIVLLVNSDDYLMLRRWIAAGAPR